MKAINAFFILAIILLTGKVSAQHHKIGISYEPSIAITSSSDGMLKINPPIFFYHSKRFAHSMGLDYIVQVKNHGFKTGLYFLDSGHKKETVQEYQPERLETYFLQYLSLPLEYYGSHKDIYLNFGPNVNYLMREAVKIGDSGDKKKQETENPLMIGIRAELGFKIPMNDALTLNLGGFYRVLYNQSGGINYGLTLRVLSRVK